MRKFKSYLSEKTTKKEFEAALTNKNIKAGCEFEFYLDEENRNEPIIDTAFFDRLERQSDKQIERINANIEDYNDEIQSHMDRAEKLREEVDKLEEKISDIETNIEEVDGNITDNKIDMIANDDKDEVTKLQKEIDIWQDDIADLTDKIENIQSDIDDKNRDIDWIEDGDMQDEMWEQYEPAPSTYDISEFMSLVDELESVGYIIEHLSQSSYNEKLFDLFEHGVIPNTDGLFIEFFDYYLDHLLSEPPFGNDAEIDEDYIQNELKFPYTFSPGWEAKPDGSLDEGGVEIVTPPEALPDLMDIIEKVFLWIDDKGYTDKSCGFHVHMSLQNNHEIDPLKLLLFFEEGLVYKNFKDRIGNSYATGIKKGHFDQIEPFTYDNIIKIAKKEKLDKEMNTSKYMGIHLIELEKNHVEFRYMGSTDYHKKFNDVREVIANYAHWLSIACDPDYKRREYITKVARLTNYFNALYLNGVIEQWKKLSKKLSPSKKRQKQAEMVIKPYIAKFKALPKLKSYKINNSKLKTSINDMMVDLFIEVGNKGK